MFNIILKYASGQAQTISEWMRYVNTVELRTSIYKTRFLMGPFVYSPFVNLCKQILHDVAVTDLLKNRSDYARYQQIYYLIGSYRGMFDPVYNVKSSGGLFTKGSTADYVLNVMRTSPMQSLPLDRSWDHWKELQPTRIIYHDSMELVTDLGSFSVEFKKHPASWMTCSIDLILLIFKYLKFVEYGNNTGDDTDIETYLQRYVIPGWFDDLRNIWLFNVLNAMMFDQFRREDVYTDGTIAPLSGLLGVAPDIHRIQAEAQQKTLLFGEVLVTEWFGHTKPLLAWIREIHDDLSVPDLRQYAHLKFLEEFPYVAFVIRLNNLIRSRESAKVNRELYQLLKRYDDSNIYANLPQQQLRDKMSYEVGHLLSETKEYQSY